MANLTQAASKSIAVALANKAVAPEVIQAVADGRKAVDQTGWTVKTAIVATSTSTTTDFAALAVGDKVLISPASAGNSMFVTVVTAGTLPQAAVVGSLYVVLRALTLQSAAAVAPIF